MPTLKQDRTLRKRHFRDMLLLGIPFAVALLCAFAGVWWLESIPGFFCAFGVGAVLGIVGVVRQERRFRRFPCPTCGTVLDRSDAGEDGRPIVFECKPCDTVWDTGFRTARGD